MDAPECQWYDQLGYYNIISDLNKRLCGAPEYSDFVFMAVVRLSVRELGASEVRRSPDLLLFLYLILFFSQTLFDLSDATMRALVGDGGSEESRVRFAQAVLTRCCRLNSQTYYRYRSHVVRNHRGTPTLSSCSYFFLFSPLLRCSSRSLVEQLVIHCRLSRSALNNLAFSVLAQEQAIPISEFHTNLFDQCKVLGSFFSCF